MKEGEIIKTIHFEMDFIVRYTMDIYINQKECKPSLHRFGLGALLPLFCGMVTFKCFFNYYIFAFPFAEEVCNALYTIITLVLFLLYLPIAFITLNQGAKYRKGLVASTYIIPLCVIVNIIYVMFITGDVGIIRREYILSYAIGTNDEVGFYFSQLNVWFCNMAVVLFIYRYLRSYKQAAKCICACIVVMAIPAILIVLQNPSYLGTRAGSFENSDVTFGGGLWNIGVVYFGSIFWIAMFLYKYMTSRQKKLVVFASCFFPFIGISGLSRTLVLMMGASMVFYFILSKKTVSLIKKVFAVIIVAVIAVMLESNVVATLLARFTDSTSGGDNVRFALWEAYGKHFSEYWLIGAPEGSVYRYYKGISFSGHHYLPHSSLLNFVIRFGIFSCLAYLSLIKNSFGLKEKQSIDERNCLIAGCIAYVVLAFINQTGYEEPVFYIMFGVLLGCKRMRMGAEEP